MDAMLTGAHLAGLLLAGGGLVMVLLVGPTAFVPAAIWTGPQDVSLRLIAEHPRIWRLANVGFAVTAVVTAAGLLVVPGLVGEGGAALAAAAAAGFLLATAPWLVMLSIRLAITPGAAADFAASGLIDPAWAPLDRLGGALFPAFMLTASGSIAALGVAIVVGGSLSAALGWACALAGLALGGGYLLLGDMLPAFVYFPTTALGIALLVSGR